MHLLADTPGAGRALSPESGPWERVPSVDLDPRLRSAWRAVAGDAAAWRPTGVTSEGGARAESPVRSVLVVDHARSSQFDALRRALREGHALPDDVATLALGGNGFRGQRDRAWQALRGNLHVCVLTRLDHEAAPLQAALTALPAVATASAVERVSGGAVRPGIKWINDLLVDGAKVAGVLTATQLQGGRLTHALFGIGLNVARAPDLAREPHAPRVGCLADADPGLAGALPLLAAALLAALDEAMALLRAGDAAAVVRAYRDRALFVGREVALWDVAGGRGAGEPFARGRVTALLDDLGLRLEGRADPVRAGRMTFVGGAAARAPEDA